MVKVDSANSKLTRGDKAHKKFLEKYGVFKEGLTHGFDSFTKIHKQTLDSIGDYHDKVTHSQEAERLQLYNIIKTSDDEVRRKEAYARLAELDHIGNERIEKHNELVQDEGDKANRNIAGGVLCLAVAGGLLASNKQFRQKVISIANNIIQK